MRRSKDLPSLFAEWARQSPAAVAVKKKAEALIDAIIKGLHGDLSGQEIAEREIVEKPDSELN